jgi:hypothetical protein
VEVRDAGLHDGLGGGGEVERWRGQGKLGVGAGDGFVDGEDPPSARWRRWLLSD